MKRYIIFNGRQGIFKGSSNERYNEIWEERKTKSKIHWTFEILERVRNVAYRLVLPPSLSNMHNVFHVSLLRKYVFDPSYVLSHEPLDMKEDLTYEERSIHILDRKEKELRNKKISLMRVLWRNFAVEEATSESEEEMRTKYLELFG